MTIALPRTGDPSDTAGQALFNPFGAVGPATRQSPDRSPPAESGDWSLPIAATAGALAFIGWMLRKLAG